MDRLVVWLSLQRTGSVRVYRRDLLRRSYRDEQGRPQKETLANLSALPDDAIEALRKVVAGRRFGGAGQDV
ncbi:MAG: hypothetical protein ACRDTD_00250 [Pseudonocardiaceae bacterium]